MKTYSVSLIIEVDEQDYPNEKSIQQAVESALDPIGIIMRVKVNEVPF